MEISNDNRSSNGASRLPMALGVIGICLGATSLFLSLSSRGDVDGFDAKIASIDARSGQVATHQEEQNERINAVDTQLHALLERIDEEFQKVNTALTSRPAAKPSAAAPAAVAAAPKHEAPAGNAEGHSGTYTIQSGDTFAKIAQHYGISAQAIADANPSVDPRRLKIGQQITLPR